MINDNDWFDECTNDLELNKNLINPNIQSNNSIDDLLMLYEAKKENKTENKTEETKKENKSENKTEETNKPMRSLVNVHPLRGCASVQKADVHPLRGCASVQKADVHPIRGCASVQRMDVHRPIRAMPLEKQKIINNKILSDYCDEYDDYDDYDDTYDDLMDKY